MARKTKAVLLIVLAALLLFTAACGQEKVQHADMQAICDEIAKLPEQPEMLTLSAKKLGSYYGIDADSCPQAIVMICGDGLRVDEIWLIQAADEGAAEQLLALAQSRLDQLAAETENYLPDQYAVVRDSRALRVGSYVALLISPDAAEMEELFRGAF